MYDSHTHLNDPKLFPKRKNYLKQFSEIWWKWLINIWAGKKFNLRWIEIAEQYWDFFNTDLFVKSTIAFYPFDILSGEITKENLTQSISELKKLYYEKEEFIVGIGECGIDLHYDNLHDKLDLQKELFALQLDLAQELNLPIVIHSRSAFSETFDIVKNYKNSKIYYHCRGYWPAELKKLQKYFPNFRVWFCGNISYPKVEELRESLKIINPDSILLETDAPYLAPQKIRWTTNHPANIKYLYEFAINLLEQNKWSFEKQIERNFFNLYYKSRPVLNSE